MLRVEHVDGTFVVMADCVGRGADIELVNRFLPGTRRARLRRRARQPGRSGRDLAAISPSARHHARTCLFGLQQACYQLGGLSAPPRQGGPVAAAPVRHAAGVAQPDIRAEVVRYVSTITTTLRPNTVIARTKALRVFFDYLAEHHPQVRRLDQIERTRHIEPYLAWARGRPWRGKNREAKTIGLTVFHQDGRRPFSSHSSANRAQ